MAKFWVSADHHLGHENIINYCKRPFRSVEHMNRELIRRWNERVEEEDTVLYLGDFCFSRPEQGVDYYVNQLNGEIIFVRGSHDDKIKSPMVSCVIKYYGIDWWCQHRPPEKYRFTYNLCAHVHNLWKLKRSGPRVVLNVGVDVWSFYPVSFPEITKFLASEGVKI